jgi:hypothetical protein
MRPDSSRAWPSRRLDPLMGVRVSVSVVRNFPASTNFPHCLGTNKKLFTREPPMPLQPLHFVGSSVRPLQLISIRSSRRRGFRMRRENEVSPHYDTREEFRAPIQFKERCEFEIPSEGPGTKNFQHRAAQRTMDSQLRSFFEIWVGAYYRHYLKRQLTREPATKRRPRDS